MAIKITTKFLTFLGLLCICGSVLNAQLDLSTSLESPAGTQIREVKFADENFGVAVGFFVASSSDFTGILATTKNGGQDWEFGTLGGALFFSVDINSNREISVAGFHLSNSAIVLRSRDDGATWTNLLFNGGNRPMVTSLYHIEYLNDQDMLAAGFNGAVVRSTDNGTSWTTTHNDADWSIWNVRHKDKLHIACASSEVDDLPVYRLYSSADDGLTWNTLEANLPTGFNIETVEFTNKGDVLGFGKVDDNFAVGRSTNNGQDWSLEYGSNDQGSLKCSYMSPQGAVYGAGTDGKILFNLDGQAWQEYHTAGDAFIWDVSGSQESVWFTSSTGRIYERKNVPTSVTDPRQAQARDFVVFHNPANKTIDISGHGLPDAFTLRLSSMSGQHIDYSVTAGEQINLANVSDGAYVYAIIVDGRQVQSGALLQY